MSEYDHVKARAFEVETRGIEPVPESERHGGPMGLLWMWFGANMGILGITLGATLVAVLRLNVLQAATAALLGAGLSFLLVGVLSVAGRNGGAPGLTLSRAVFGVRGNKGPTVASWLGFVGWETVMCTTAAFALLALLDLAGIPGGTVTTTICVLVIVLIAATIGLFGHTTIMFLQKWLTWIFGAMTVIVLGFLITQIDWAKAMDVPAGSFTTLISGIGLIAAGTGLGWLAAGADYARYLPRSTSARSIVGATVSGAVIPLFALITMGALMAVDKPNLASANDPVAAIGAALPQWMLVPYLITAIAGLITAADLSMYSSGLNLITGGIRVRRTTAVAVDAVLITIGGLYITVIAQDFFGIFIAFLTLLAIPLTAWGVIFGHDMIRRTHYDEQALLDPSPSGRYWYTGGFEVPRVTAWMLAIAAGAMFTSVTVAGKVVYAGWFNHTWLGSNGMAWLVAGVVAAGAAEIATVIAARIKP